MTKDEIRQYQLAQLELMAMVDELCSDLSLTYYIIGGTLLGAIRHKGFIPWDPDIDIAMPRKDYEKLREYFASNKSDRYFYQHHSTEKNHFSGHALIKIKDSHVFFKSKGSRFKPVYDGIYLDIFPLDNAPLDKKLQEKQMKKIKGIKRLIEIKSAKVFENNKAPLILGKYAVSLLLTPLTFTYLNKLRDKMMRKYDGKCNKYLVSMASHYSYWKQLMPSEVYGEPHRIQFENLSLCAPAQSEEYLTRIYGDFMKLPPEDKCWEQLNFLEKVEYSLKE